MKKRIVLFKGQTGWFMTPEFIGDKEELLKGPAGKSCDENWAMIARKFTQAKTKEEFSKMSAWAQRLYHDGAAPAQSQDIQLYSLPETLPDEVLVVYEDLGATGIQILANCSVCGRTHFLVYRPDKSTDASLQCLSCASKLVVRGTLPGPDAWSDALDMYRKPAPSYRLAVPEDFPSIQKALREAAEKKQICEEDIASAAKTWLADSMKDSGAASHMNAPVKILKIVGYSGDEFIYQVMFRDWSTAVVRARFLKSLK